MTQARTRIVRHGQPCGHAGCLHHLLHECEGCGRLAGQGEAVLEQTLLPQVTEDRQEMVAWAREAHAGGQPYRDAIAASIREMLSVDESTDMLVEEEAVECAS